MKFSFLLICLLPILVTAQSSNFLTPFEKNGENYSATYAECIAFYDSLASSYQHIQLDAFGEEYNGTDIGKYIHLVTISDKPAVKVQDIEEDKATLLIMNGIHAGEPCGIDACMMLARDLVEKPEMKVLLEHVTVCIIPVYNESGMLNRGCCSRANQLGPEEYGFRGNALNLDLNRDFMKVDSRNAKIFSQIMRTVDPDFFIDTHTTNGADYQATLTYIPTSLQIAKAGSLADYMSTSMVPAVEAHMATTDFIISPYMNSIGRTPDEKGISVFNATPRYSTGYVELHHTMGFITEAHMLKPFKDRVEATYEFLKGVITQMNTDYEEINIAVGESHHAVMNAEELYINWEPDTSKKVMIPYKGYEAEFYTSPITGYENWKYNREKPIEKTIPFYNELKPTTPIKKPFAYVIPQAYTKATSLIKAAGFNMKELSKDTSLEVEVYYIEDYNTLDNPYEGHYYHNQVTIRKDTQTIQYYRGDRVIETDQPNVLFLLNALEPEAVDSYFRWNFFDNCLSRKEYFSGYLFEEKAREMLGNDPQLKKDFETAKEDVAFSSHWWPQLDFIYQRSEHYEPTHNRYPITRLNQKINLPLE